MADPWASLLADDDPYISITDLVRLLQGSPEAVRPVHVGRSTIYRHMAKENRREVDGELVGIVRHQGPAVGKGNQSYVYRRQAFMYFRDELRKASAQRQGAAERSRTSTTRRVPAF